MAAEGPIRSRRMRIRCADGEPQNVPQTGRPGFDEFLEFKRRDCDFVGETAPLKAAHSGKTVV
jgi:hypothetical protein